MTNIDIDDVVEGLSEQTERPVNEIKAEIEGLMQEHGYELPGAIAVWRSTNRYLIAEDRKDYSVRVMAKEVTNTTTFDDGSQSEVGNIHFAFANPETGEMEFNQTTAWGAERVKELYDALELGATYKLQARLTTKGYLGWIKNIEPIDDSEVPTIKEMDSLPIASIVDAVDDYEFIKGWVGKVISPQGTPIGFELDDLSGSPPITVWHAGKFSKMTPEQIDEVNASLVMGAESAVYGYVSGGDGEPRVSASTVWAI